MSETPQASASRTVLLSVMMFLQFFLWGAWFVTLSPYMGAHGFDGPSIGNAYSTAPIAAILAPVFLGMVADRYFASQRVMALLHLLGGAILLVVPRFAGDASGGGWLFIGLLLAHMLCYMPTLGLSNTVAFHAMDNPEKQFPIVRVWGTIGWIVAGIAVSYFAASLHPFSNHLAGGLTVDQFNQVDAAITAKTTVAPDLLEKYNLTKTATAAARSGDPQFFYIAGISGVLLGLFSLALPHTPPPMKGKPFSVGGALGLDALRLLKDRNFLVFSLASMLICIPLAAYYQKAAAYVEVSKIENFAFKMTFGQMSEIFFMLVMPLFFKRLGVKWMLAAGMLAWVVRYGLFAGAWDTGGNHIVWMIIGGILLHGICYDFFFVTGQIYTEQSSPKEIRAQAQGFLVLITQGVGMLIGNQAFGRLVGYYTNETTKAVDNWKMVWAIPALFALAILVLFVVCFRGKPRGTPATA